MQTARNLTQHIVNIKKNILLGLDLILPPRCVVSGVVVDSPGMMAPDAWTRLRLIADPMCAVCGYPFDFGTEGEMLCGSCLREAPPFARARAVLVYDDASRPMILQFKHGDHMHHVRSFIPMMQRAAGPMITDSDVVVPVPLHRWRLLRRRYNQAAVLAKELADIGGGKYMPDILQRRRATRSQGHLGFRARYRNVKGAFSVAPEKSTVLTGKTVLLVDDVYTSGATIKECAKVLSAAGAAKVNVLTLARVVRPEYAD